MMRSIKIYLSIASIGLFAGAPMALAAPSAPSGITATQYSGSTSILISWEALLDETITGYQLYRSTSASQNGSVVANNVSGTDFSDITVSYNQTYYYRVASRTETDISALSSAVSVKPVIPPPVGITARDTGEGAAEISWSRPYDTLPLTFTIVRSGSPNGSYSVVKRDVDGVTYRDATVKTGISYYYKVRSRTQSGKESADSNAVAVRVSDTSTPPSPRSPKARYDTKKREAVITWSAPANDDAVVAYQVFRSQSPTDEGNQRARVTKREYRDFDVGVGGMYYYRIKTVNSGNIESLATDPAILDLRTSAQAGFVARDLVARATGKSGEVALSWTNPAADNFSFVRVYRNTSPGKAGALIANNVRGAQYTDKKLDNGFTYYYTLRAVDDDRTEHEPSMEVYALPFVARKDVLPPEGVRGFSVHDAGTGSALQLAWTNPPRTEYAFIKIYRSTERGTLGSPLVNTLLASEYTDDTVSAGIRYFYTVVTIDAEGRESTHNVQLSGVPTDRIDNATDDTDGDGLPDVWERAHGYHPYLKNLLDADDDADGITLGEEYAHQTSPWNPDSDDDGYSDGTEVINGYSPRGPGRERTAEARVVKSGEKAFAYGKARLSGLAQEQAEAQSLKDALVAIFGRAIPNSRSHWPVLVNSYIYGGYTPEEIAHTLRFGPGLVHPAIPASEWRLGAEYQRKNR